MDGWLDDFVRLFDSGVSEKRLLYDWLGFLIAYRFCERPLARVLRFFLDFVGRGEGASEAWVERQDWVQTSAAREA